MEIKDYKRTTRTSDVVHVFDADKDMNWFIVFEKTEGCFTESREAMNYDFFKKQGAVYMQQVYDLAYKHVEIITK